MLLQIKQKVLVENELNEVSEKVKANSTIRLARDFINLSFLVEQNIFL